MNSAIPPPPPVRPANSYYLSPALISVIGALGSIFLVLSYYQLLLKYCTCVERLVHRGRPRTHQEATVSDDENSNSGLDASIIAKIPTLKYNTKDIATDTECSVCLTEFTEGELVRLLPKCRHAFHISCIGMWLNSHQNCPLCRADILMGLLHLLSPSPSAEKDDERDADRRPRGAEVESQRSNSLTFSGGRQDTANAGERPLTRSLSNASFSDVPPDGASSSQWYRRFRWSKRVSSPSREEMHGRLLQSGTSTANQDCKGRPDEVAIDLGGHANIGNVNSRLQVSNGGEGTSSAMNKHFVAMDFVF